MAQGDTNITVVGNIVADPEIRFTPSGTAVANFRIASTPRQFNKQTNTWEDQEALFLTCNVWRQAAENVAESLAKGMRVIVAGRLRQRSYQTKEGENRTVMEVEVDEVGPSLTFAKAQVTRTPRDGGGQKSQGGNSGGWNNQQAPQQQPQQGQQQSQGGDPWNSTPQGGFSGAGDDSGTPPF